MYGYIQNYEELVQVQGAGMHGYEEMRRAEQQTETEEYDPRDERE